MARSLSNQDISWFLDLFDKEQLNLDPPYQRRSVWSPRDKRYFIDTILNGYPAPPVFLHKTLDESGRATYHVVDGKQRLKTILDFRSNRISIPEDFANVNLQKKKWKDLDRETRERFWNYILIVEMLPDVSDAFVKNIFERINRNSRKLMPQELRHAKFDGWLVTNAESEAEKPSWKDFGISTAARAKRMSNVQFISELMAVILWKRLQGFDQEALDLLYAEFDDIQELPEFDEDEFLSSFESTKRKIEELIRSEPRLTGYLKIQTHFYSLWTFLILEKPQMEVDELSKKYLDFLDRVNLQLSIPEDADEIYRAAIDEYSANAKGANTELPPRQARHDALKILAL